MAKILFLFLLYLMILGIKALTDFVAIDVSYASRHQQVIIDCLNDQDDSLKRKVTEMIELKSFVRTKTF